MSVINLLDDFGTHRARIVAELSHEGHPDQIGPALLIAIGIRESGLDNIDGDGGHGRGWLQIDDRSHAAWLHTHAGCRSGSWTPVRGHTALEPGYCPSLSAATIYAIEILQGNIALARARGVQEQLRFAVAAYNGGAGNALAGLRDGNVDRYTTGHDYSHNVIDQLEPEVRAWLSHHGIA